MSHQKGVECHIIITVAVQWEDCETFSTINTWVMAFSRKFYVKLAMKKKILLHTATSAASLSFVMFLLLVPCNYLNGFSFVQNTAPTAHFIHTVVNFKILWFTIHWSISFVFGHCVLTEHFTKIIEIRWLDHKIDSDDGEKHYQEKLPTTRIKIDMFTRRSAVVRSFYVGCRARSMTSIRTDFVVQSRLLLWINSRVSQGVVQVYGDRYGTHPPLAVDNMSLLNICLVEF